MIFNISPGIGNGELPLTLTDWTYNPWTSSQPWTYENEKLNLRGNSLQSPYGYGWCETAIDCSLYSKINITIDEFTASNACKLGIVIASERNPQPGSSSTEYETNWYNDTCITISSGMSGTLTINLPSEDISVYLQYTGNNSVSPLTISNIELEV